MLLMLLLILSIATYGTCQSNAAALSHGAAPSVVINNSGYTDQLIDCSSYTAAVAATPARTTKNSTSPASITPKPSFTMPSFEEYWCSTVMDFVVDHEVYPNNEPGNCQGYLCGLNSSARAFCSTWEAAQYSSWARTQTYPLRNQWSHAVSSPCCDAWCNIKASTVELLYWPTPAPAPNITTIVGPDGYTYISPSAYVVWHAVSATGDCGALGQTYANVTVAYDPSDLSTIVPDVFDVTKINYADLFTNCTGHASYFATQSDTNFLQKHCFPSLTYPSTGLQSIDPAWANCDTDLLLGFINDPPRALVPATTLGPGPTGDPRASTNPAPAPSIPPPVPSKTDPPSGSPSTTNAGNEAPEIPPTDPYPIGDPPPAHPSPESSLANGFKGPAITSFAIPIPGEVGWSGTVLNSNSVVVVGATVVAGAPASPVLGHQVSVDPVASNIVVDGQIYPLPAPNPSSSDPGPPDPVNDPVLSNPGQNDPVNDPVSSDTVINGHTIQTTQSPDIIVVDGQSIVRGATPIMASGTPIALRSNGDLILGTSTLPGFIPSASVAPGKVITTAGQILTILSNGAAIDGQTLSIGQGITISGTPISLGLDGLVIASSKVNLPAITAPQVLTAAGQTMTIGANGGVIIGGTTLVPNAPAVNIAGTRISLGPNGLIVGTSTITLPTITPAPVISAAGQAGIFGPEGYFTIAGTTLSPEAPAITIAGTRISLGSNGLIIGTSTLPLPPVSTVTIAGHTYPISKVSNGLVIGGSTLHMGQPAITISGTPVALEGSGLVIGTSTVPYQDVIASSSALAIGDFILSGLNGGFAASSMTGVMGSNQTLDNTTSSTGGVLAFQGHANSIGGARSILPTLAIVILCTWLEGILC